MQSTGSPRLAVDEVLVDLDSCSNIGGLVTKGLVIAAVTKSTFAAMTNVSKGYLSRLSSRGIKPTQRTAMTLINGLDKLEKVTFSREKALKKFGYITLRSLDPNNFDPYEIGVWIRKARTYAQLTSRELGERIERSERAVRKYENNDSVPALEIMKTYSLLYLPR